MQNAHGGHLQQDLQKHQSQPFLCQLWEANKMAIIIIYFEHVLSMAKKRGHFVLRPITLEILNKVFTKFGKNYGLFILNIMP